MGWVSLGGSVSASTERSSTNENLYGTRTPILSQDYINSVNAYRAGLNPNGATATQQQAIDYMSGNIGGARSAIDPYNNQLAWYNMQLGSPQVQGQYDRFINMQAPQLGQAAQLGAQTITAEEAQAMRGSEFMDAYRNPFQADVIDAALLDYDTGGDRALSAARASRDASGAFGDRAAIDDAILGGEIARGRGSLAANLRYQGFDTAANLGMQDASRFTQTNQFNAGQRQNANIFNANARQSADQFNIGTQNQRDIVNIGAQQTNTGQQLTALGQLQNNIIAQAGLTQQQADNVITANGIDLEAAQSLLAAGSITQAQLAALVDMAGAGNGYSFNQTGTGTTNTSGIEGQYKFGFGV